MSEVPQPAERSARSRSFDWTATVLISLATFCSGWCTYQTARWGGQQAHEYAFANAARVASLHASQQAQLDALLDVSLFSQWLTRTAANEKTVADELLRRFPPRLAGPFRDWYASAEGRTLPPGSPFQQPDYQRQSREKIAALDASLDAHIAAAERSNFLSTTYVMPIGLSAIVLAITGIALKVQSERAQRALGILAAIVLIAAIGVALWLWLEALQTARVLPA